MISFLNEVSSFTILIKKTSISFFTERNDEHENLKRTLIITYIKGLPHSQRLALYAKVF